MQWWRSEVEIRTGRRSNRWSKMAENLGWRRRAAGMSHGARRQQFATASRFWSIPILMPRSTVTRVWLTEWAHLGRLCGTLTSDWQSFFFFFFFFFLSFRECCLTRQWQSTECDARYMVQRKKVDVILRLLVDRYRRTKPPKPDAPQFVVPARLPKPVIGSGGLSSSRFDDDVPEVNCTWTASFSWRIKEAALWFESHGSKNLTGGGTTWSSQSTSTDWLTRTHHWSSPRSKLAYKKPTSTRKLRKFPVTSGQGSKHRDWTGSGWWARWRSQSSSCQHHVITWRGLIPADHEYLDSVAWPCHDCEVAPVWHHDVTNPRTCQFSAVCLTVFPFEFRPRTFTIGFYGKNSIISELMLKLNMMHKFWGACGHIHCYFNTNPGFFRILTTPWLCFLVQKWQMALDKGERVQAAFLDLNKMIELAPQASLVNCQRMDFRVLHSPD